MMNNLHVVISQSFRAAQHFAWLNGIERRDLLIINADYLYGDLGGKVYERVFVVGRLRERLEWELKAWAYHRGCSIIWCEPETLVALYPRPECTRDCYAACSRGGRHIPDCVSQVAA